MESVKIVINSVNCEVNAQAIVSLLRGKEFGIMPIREGNQDDSLEAIKGLRLHEGNPPVPGFNHVAGYSFLNGKLVILFNTGRMISWDLNVEAVEIQYWDKGYITIRKDHPENGTRVVMIFFE